MSHRVAETYAPLDTDFNKVVESYFPGVSSEQRERMRMMFFAGAACTFQVLVEKPELQETVFDELLDHADRLEHVGA